MEKGKKEKRRREKDNDVMPLGISGTFNFMIVFHAARNVSFYLLVFANKQIEACVIGMYTCLIENL